MIRKLILAASVLLAAVTLGACGMPQGAPQTSGQSVSESAPCRVTEQKGCLEFDILNLRAPNGFNVQKDGKPHGPTYYQKYISGQLEAAKSVEVVAYVFAANPTPTSMMAEYRLPENYRDAVNANRGKKLTTMFSPLRVTEIPPESGPTFGTVYNIGQPQRAFKISIPNAGGALQVPRGMFGPNSYVLFCPVGSDGRTVYPDRISRKDGYWLTPADLNAPGDYIVVPLLFNNEKSPQGTPTS